MRAFKLLLNIKIIFACLLASMLPVGVQPRAAFAQTGYSPVDNSDEWRMPYYDKFNSSSLFWNPNAPIIPDPSQYDITMEFVRPNAYSAAPRSYYLDVTPEGPKFLVLTKDRLTRYSPNSGLLEWSSPVLSNMQDIVAVRPCWVGGPTVVAVASHYAESIEGTVYFIDYQTGKFLGEVSIDPTSNAISLASTAIVSDADNDGNCEVYPANLSRSSIVRYVLSGAGNTFVSTPQVVNLSGRVSMLSPVRVRFAANTPVYLAYLLVNTSGEVILHLRDASDFSYVSEVVIPGMRRDTISTVYRTNDGGQGIAVFGAINAAEARLATLRYSPATNLWSVNTILSNNLVNDTVIGASSSLLSVDLDGNGYDEIILNYQTIAGRSYNIFRYNSDLSVPVWQHIQPPSQISGLAYGHCRESTTEGVFDIGGSYFVPSPLGTKLLMLCGRSNSGVSHAYLARLIINSTNPLSYSFQLAYDFGPNTHFVGAPALIWSDSLGSQTGHNSPTFYRPASSLTGYLFVQNTTNGVSHIYSVDLTLNNPPDVYAYHGAVVAYETSGLIVHSIPDSAAWFMLSNFAYTPRLASVSGIPPHANFRFRVPDSNVIDKSPIPLHIYAGRNNGQWIATSFVGPAYNIHGATMLTSPTTIPLVDAGYTFHNWYLTDIDSDGILEYPRTLNNGDVFQVVNLSGTVIMSRSVPGFDKIYGHYLGHTARQIVVGFTSVSGYNADIPNIQNVQAFTIGHSAPTWSYRSGTFNVFPSPSYNWVGDSMQDYFYISNSTAAPFLSAVLIDGRTGITRLLSTGDHGLLLNHFYIAHLSPSAPIPRHALVNNVAEINSGGALFQLLDISTTTPEPPLFTAVITNQRYGIPALINIFGNSFSQFPDEIVYPVKTGIDIGGISQQGSAISFSRFTGYDLAYGTEINYSGCEFSYPYKPLVILNSQGDSLRALPNCNTIPNFRGANHIVGVRTSTNQPALVAAGKNGLLYVIMPGGTPNASPQVLFSYPLFHSIRAIALYNKEDGIPGDNNIAEILALTSNGDLYGLRFVPRNTYAPPRDVADGDSGFDIDVQNSRLCLRAAWRRPLGTQTPSFYYVMFRDGYGMRMMNNYRRVPYLASTIQSHAVCTSDASTPLVGNLLLGGRYFAEIIAVYPDGRASRPAFSDGVLVDDTPGLETSTLTVSHIQRAVGEPVTWTLALRNTGNSNSNISVYLNVPNTLAVLSSSVTTGVLASNVWNLAIAAGDIATLTLTTTASQAGVYEVSALIVDQNGLIPDVMLEERVNYELAILLSEKQYLPQHIWTGGMTLQRVRLYNEGRVTITVGMTEEMPSGLIIGGAITVTPTPNYISVVSNSVELSVTIPPAQSAIITVPITATQSGNFDACAVFSGIFGGNKFACASILVSSPEQLTRFDKRVSSLNAPAGGEVTYSIFVTNTSSNLSLSAVLTDVLPPGFVLNGTPTMLPASVGTLNWDTGGRITATISSLAPSSGLRIAIPVRVGAHMQTGTYENCALMLASNRILQACAYLGVVSLDEGVSGHLRAHSQIVFRGQPLTYTLAFSNPYPFTSTLIVTLPVPSSLTANPPQASGGITVNLVGAEMRARVILAPYGTGIITLPTIVAGLVNHVNACAVWSIENGNGSAKQTCETVTVLRHDQSLQLTKQAHAIVVDASLHALITYSIGVTNTSPLTVADLLLIDTINHGKFVTVPSGAGIDSALRTFTVPINIAPFASYWFTAIASPPFTDTLVVNTVTLSHTQMMSPLVALNYVSVQGGADVGFTRTHSINGGLVTFTLHVRNSGNLTATGLMIRSPLATGAEHFSGPTADRGMATYLPSERLLVWSDALPPHENATIVWTQRLMSAPLGLHYHTAWLYQNARMIAERSVSFGTSDGNIANAARVDALAYWYTQPLSGVIMNVLPLTRSKATDASGNASFIITDAGTILVAPIPPNNFVPDRTFEILPNLTHGEIRQVRFDFTMVPDGSGALRGLTFVDRNGDGFFDPLTDVPLPNAIVETSLPWAPLVQSNIHGRFVVTAPIGGAVLITAQTPSGYSPSTPHVISANVFSDVAEVAFGFSPCQPWNCQAINDNEALLYGFIYSDADNELNGPEGLMSAADGPLANRIAVITSSDAITYNAVSDANGFYFIRLPITPTGSGYFTVSVDINPTERALLPVPVPVALRGGYSLRLDFGLANACSGLPVSGWVFSDTMPVQVFRYGEDPPMPIPATVTLLDSSSNTPITSSLTTYAFNFGCRTGGCTERLYTPNPIGWQETTPIDQCAASTTLFGKTLNGTNVITPVFPEVSLYRLHPINGRILPSGTTHLRWQLLSNEPTFGYRLCLDGICTYQHGSALPTAIQDGQTREWIVGVCLDRDCRYIKWADDEQLWQFHGFAPYQAVHGVLSAVPPAFTRYNSAVNLYLFVTQTITSPIRLSVHYLQPTLNTSNPIRWLHPTSERTFDLPPNGSEVISSVLWAASLLPTNTVGYSMTGRLALLFYDDDGNVSALREYSHTWSVIPWRSMIPVAMHAYESPDSYEPDNTIAEAKYIQNGETQSRNFAPHSNANDDFIKFVVTRPLNGRLVYRLTITPGGTPQHSGSVYCLSGCRGNPYHTAVPLGTRHVVIDIAHNSNIDAHSTWVLELRPAPTYSSPSHYTVHFGVTSISALVTMGGGESISPNLVISVPPK